MPEFDKNKIKIKARKDMIDFYRKHSGRKALCDDRQFWALCSIQTQLPSSEINQLFKMGLIKKSQYVGVDLDENKINLNKKTHPEATWIIGDWVEVLKDNPKLFNPGIVFLDSTSMASTESLLRATRITLCRCPVNTYLFVNVMLNNPRTGNSKISLETFPSKISEFINAEDWKGWQTFGSEGIICYPYNCTGLTNMALYPFWKKK